ncbi:hypothetical protein ABE82_26535 (plasmid) [Paenibacillus peoriae]|uniref:hypothetical protein n=1 Tax=Paenibacillus peoriae TaxID=59893 RepID=UPI0007209FBD|nr:hypothetical protein [Paenibacillus peoriae]ALS09972.1 hypothetical protein ABE82_26535 [Paenibacillus peoriae]
MTAEQVEAKTHWVWTDEAVRRNLFQNNEAHTPVWENYKKRAPRRCLVEGIIREAQATDLPRSG